MATALAFTLFLAFQLARLRSADTAAPGSPCNDILRNISVFPGSAEYEAASEIYNPAYARDLPAFIAMPLTVQDVQKCLQCSYSHLVPCAVKSGGHSSAGYSTMNSTGFVIYLSKMKQMDWTNDTVKVQAGARWGDVFEAQKDSSLIVSGSCSSVGVAGFTLGGGMSFLSRNFGGLSSDNTLSFTMVTANGSSVVVANASSNTDLYFALRGGGGGNFGVVVDMTFRLHPAQPNYVYGNVIFPGGEASEQALAMVGETILTDKRLNLDMSISGNPAALTLYPFYVGSLKSVLDFLRPIMDKASSVYIKSYATYMEVHREFSETIHPKRIALHPQLLKGCFLNAIPPEIPTLLFKDPLPSSCSLQFLTLGGDISSLKADETAFFYRGAQYAIYTPCEYENNEERDKVSKFVTELYNSLQSADYCYGSYVNDMDRNLVDWQKKYYGGNYDKLKMIQDRWNPSDKGAFHFPQEIGSHYNPPLPQTPIYYSGTSTTMDQRAFEL